MTIKIGGSSPHKHKKAPHQPRANPKPRPKGVAPKARTEIVRRPPPLRTRYFALVEAFQLERIRDDDHLTQALAVVEGLMTRPLGKGEESYLDALVDLIEVYESKASPIPPASESDILEALMGQQDLSQSALAEKTGIVQSTISAVLSGKRRLTRDQVVKLARFFHVSAEVFLQAR